MFSTARIDSSVSAMTTDLESPARERLYFESLKESRGSYFVEYHPPIGKNPFATLSLVYPNKFELSEVTASMKAEMKRWMRRYPVPVMVTAFDAAENILGPQNSLDDGHLVGWFTPGTKEIAFSWKLNEVPPFVNDSTSLPDWRTIYTDLPFRTDTQVRSNAQEYLEKRRREVRAIKIVLTLWFAVIPAAWAITLYLGPEWLGLVVTLYTLWQVWQAWRKLIGLKKPTPREEEKAEKERKMAHYYYHCERNPDGFWRLKAENFEKDISERNRDEAERLANKRSKIEHAGYK